MSQGTAKNKAQADKAASTQAKVQGGDADATEAKAKAAEKAEAERVAAEQKAADEAAAEKAKADEKAAEDAKSATRAAAARTAAPGDTEPDNKGLTYAGENPLGEVSGPGTGATAPPESTYRMPSTVITDNSDNPLDPPSDHKTQADPPTGYSESSTDHVYASMGGRTIAGEDFSAFTGEDGRRLRPSSLFDEEDQSKTYVTAKVRAYEEFYYPNTTEIARRLVMVPGQRFGRAQAEQMKAAMKDAPTPLAEV